MPFLHLRANRQAHHEFRAYAIGVLRILKYCVQRTYDAHLEHRLGGVQLSAPALKAAKSSIAGERVSQTTSGLSKGKWRERRTALERTQTLE